MIAGVVLSMSLLFQLIAVALSIRLVRLTSRRWAWTLITLAITLMAFRRSITLYRLITDNLNKPPDISAEAVALLISTLMVVGIALIARSHLNIDPAKSDLKEEPLLKRMTQTALGLAAVAVVGSGAIVVLAYRASYQNTLDDMTHSLSNIARHFTQIIETEISRHSKAEVFDSLDTFWEAYDIDYENSYLCVIGPDSRLLMHTRHPELVGQDVGAMSIQFNATNETSTFQTLILNNQSGSGTFIAQDGEKQILTFAYAPNADILLAVHTPYDVVAKKTLATALPWSIGAGVMTLILFPLAISMLLWSYKAAQRTSSRRQAILHQTEARYQALTSVTSVGIFHADADGKCLYVNDRWCELTGLTPQQALGDGWSKAMHPEDRERIAELWQQAITSRLPFNSKYRYQRPDGSVSWIFGQALPEFDASGNVIGYLGTSTDITEIKQAEEALQKTHSYLKLLKTAAVASNEATDVDSAIQTVLDEVCACTGWTMGTAHVRVAGDADRAKFKQFWHFDDPEHFEPFRIASQKIQYEKGFGLPGSVFTSGKPIWVPNIQLKAGELALGDLGASLGLRSALFLPILIGSEVVGVLVFSSLHVEEPDRQFLEAMADIGTQLGRVIERKEAEATLTNVARGYSINTDELFFKSLASHLALELDAEYTIIGELCPDNPQRVSTIAALADGEFIENFQYDLKGSPCENVTQQSQCAYKCGIQDQFPEDQLLVDMGVEAYVGTPLNDTNGNAIGLMAVLFRHELEDTRKAETLLRIYAVRAQAELERKWAEDAIQEKEKQLDNLLSNVGVIVLEGDPFDIFYVGGQVERILGYPKELWLEDPGGPVGFWKKHLHPDDMDKHEICRQAIELGNDHAFEYRMIAADGREIWFYDTITVETENGAPVKTRSVMVDITDKKELEKASLARIHRAERQQAAITELLTHPTLLGDDLNEAAKVITQLVGTAIDVERTGIWLFSKDRKSIRCENMFELTPNRHTRGMVQKESDYPSYFQALKTSRAIVASDAIADPRTCEFKDKYIEPLGITSMLDVAIRVSGEIVGLVCHEHVGEKRDWTPDEIAFAGQVADQVALVLSNQERRKDKRALWESEEQVRLLLDSTAEAIYGLDLDGNCTFCNPASLEMLGYDNSDQLLGKNMHDLIHHTHNDGSHYPATECRSYDAIRDGRGTHVDDEVLWKQNGESFDAEYWSFPIRREGQIVGSVVTFLDITERKRAEEKIYRSESRLQEAQRLAHLGSWDWDITGGSLHWSDEIYRIFGLSVNEFEATYEAFLQRVHPGDRESVEQMVKLALEENHPYNIEHRIIMPDGEVRHVHEQGEVARDESGRPLRMIGTIQDITERKISKQRQQLLMAELDHRVKNNLSAVIALAEQTLTGTNSLAEFRESYIGRIRALARIHETLAATKWTGAKLNEILRLTLDPYSRDSRHRISTRGEDIMLDARTCQPITMALHELATNAAKYGSLSTAEGKISIEWRVDEENKLHFSWIETGGPPIAEPPQMGFGSSLIRGVIEHELAGTVGIEYPPEGLTCRMIIPMEPQPLNAVPFEPKITHYVKE